MPDNHEPTGGQHDEFRPSTPELTPALSPNLGDTWNPQSVLTQEEFDQAREEGRDVRPYSLDKIANRNYRIDRRNEKAIEHQEVKLERAEIAESYMSALDLIEGLVEKADDQEKAQAAFKLVMDQIHSDLGVPDFARQNVLMYRRTLAESQEKADEVVTKHAEHLEQHREEYENSAVNDYNTARAANPEQYPEPLTYGDSNQQSPSQEEQTT